MIADFHSHILPGIDDGSADVAESLEMLRQEAEQGIRQVVATPHFYARHDSPERFLEKRAHAAALLQEAAQRHPELPEVFLGAEVYFFPGISDSDALSRLTINQSRYLLLEMPMPPWTEAMYREIAGIYEKQGLIPIIAHVDRYIRPFRTYDIPKRLAELPVLVQANAGFFLRPGSRRMALKLLREDRIHLLGSDCHNISTRPPNLAGAQARIEGKLSAKATQRICGYQDQVLRNE